VGVFGWFVLGGVVGGFCFWFFGLFFFGFFVFFGVWFGFVGGVLGGVFPATSRFSLPSKSVLSVRGRSFSGESSEAPRALARSASAFTRLGSILLPRLF